MTDTFSIDDAVAEVMAGSAEPKTPAAPDDGEGGEQQPVESDDGNEIPGDQPGSDEAGESPAEDAGGDDEAPESPAAEAPVHWSAEGKAVFATLSPEAQAAILAEASASVKLTEKKLAEVANERKEAKAEREKYAQNVGRIVEAAERAEMVFADRWKGWTPEVWAHLAQKDASQYTALKAQHDAEQAAFQQARSAREEAEEHQYAEWLSEQQELLKELAPDLVDEQKGEQNKRELFSYLTKAGYSQEELTHAGAKALSIARKAMLYDAGVAKLSQPTKPAPAKPSLKPGPANADTPQQRKTSTAHDRFRKTGSIDDAVELLLARQG